MSAPREWSQAIDCPGLALTSLPVVATRYGYLRAQPCGYSRWGYVCTRAGGHTGRHHAGIMGGTIVAVWEQR